MSSSGLYGDSIVDSAKRALDRTLGDHLFCSLISSQTKTNIGTSYVDVFPAIYNGVPIAIDTTGYSKIGIRILWNKNGGTGRHDIRFVNHSNTSQILIHSESTPSGLSTGVNSYFDVVLPVEFQNYRGDIRLQAKSDNTTDDPIFDAIFIYLIR